MPFLTQELAQHAVDSAQSASVVGCVLSEDAEALEKASRAQDLADISRMLGAATESDLQTVRTAIRQYFPEALEDMASLATLGPRLEYEAT